MTVFFSMVGKAKLNLDYTLSPTSQVVIPAGQSSADVVMTALTDSRSGERSEKATMNLTAGSGYTISGTLNKATVTIFDGASATSGHRHR